MPPAVTIAAMKAPHCMNCRSKSCLIPVQVPFRAVRCYGPAQLPPMRDVAQARVGVVSRRSKGGSPSAETPRRTC